MRRLYFIAVFLFIAGNLFGQVSHATVSATIVTPVGAEISDDTNFERNSPKSNITSSSYNAVIPGKNDPIYFLKVIGETFSHQITVENNYPIFKRKIENGNILTDQKLTPYVSITVNFD